MKERVDVPGGCARIEHEAHDRAAQHVHLSGDRPAREFVVQPPEQAFDVVPGVLHYTRCSTLLSMNRFRRQNGGGERVRRCSRKLLRDDANQGASSGLTVAVHRGGSTLLIAAACSTVAAR